MELINIKSSAILQKLLVPDVKKSGTINPKFIVALTNSKDKKKLTDRLKELLSDESVRNFLESEFSDRHEDLIIKIAISDSEMDLSLILNDISHVFKKGRFETFLKLESALIKHCKNCQVEEFLERDQEDEYTMLKYK